MENSQNEKEETLGTANGSSTTANQEEKPNFAALSYAMVVCSLVFLFIGGYVIAIISGVMAAIAFLYFRQEQKHALEMAGQRVLKKYEEPTLQKLIKDDEFSWSTSSIKKVLGHLVNEDLIKPGEDFQQRKPEVIDYLKCIIGKRDPYVKTDKLMKILEYSGTIISILSALIGFIIKLTQIL